MIHDFRKPCSKTGEMDTQRTSATVGYQRETKRCYWLGQTGRIAAAASMNKHQFRQLIPSNENSQDKLNVGQVAGPNEARINPLNLCGNYMYHLVSQSITLHFLFIGFV
jgi:hypothetical protein